MCSNCLRTFLSSDSIRQYMSHSKSQLPAAFLNILDLLKVAVHVCGASALAQVVAD